jgi:hypothetical protein
VVTIGIDAHKGSLAVALIDELARELAHEQFGNDPGTASSADPFGSP